MNKLYVAVDPAFGRHRTAVVLAEVYDDGGIRIVDAVTLAPCEAFVVSAPWSLDDLKLWAAKP